MKKFIIGILAVLLTMPCVLRAEEIEIPLMEVISMQPIPGDDPLDGPSKEGSTPPRPNNFRATLNGHALSVTKLEASIPSAQAIVVNAQTGSIVLNQQFTTSIDEQIPNTGVHVLRIETEGGALVGQFIVQ